MAVGIKTMKQICRQTDTVRGRWVRRMFLVSVLFLCGCASDKEQTLQIRQAQSGDQSDTGTGEQPQEQVQKELSGEAAAAESGQVTVYVCGAVCRPGVYTLEGSVRMAQAVEAAGGMLENADTDVLNLAQFISDGQMIRIPVQGEEQEASAESSGKTAQGQTDNRIDINRADASQLQQIPGLGQAKADAIIRYREEHGGFKSIEDIMQIGGIKEASFAKMKDYICVN